jgi:hypothetical protein
MNFHFLTVVFLCQVGCAAFAAVDHRFISLVLWFVAAIGYGSEVMRQMHGKEPESIPLPSALAAIAGMVALFFNV